MIAWGIGRETLSDGSDVYNVVGKMIAPPEDGEGAWEQTGRVVTLHAWSLEHAQRLLTTVSDVDGVIG